MNSTYTSTSDYEWQQMLVQLDLQDYKPMSPTNAAGSRTQVEPVI